MELGVFIPIGNNGWIISKTSPQYMPSFELNKSITQKAESYDMDFVLSMVKLRGFGGETEFWDHNLESFTLMSGLAAVTSKIRLWASTAVLSLHPAMVARMAVTIDDISEGRFGINIVSGWNKSEYEQMGVWPGDEHFENRYKLSREYMDVMNGLWQNGNYSYDGDFYTLDDCLGKPQPKNNIEIVCAGQSDEGMAFCAEYGDYQFVIGGTDLNALKATTDRLDVARAKTGRDIKAIALYQIFIEDTDEKAEEYVQYCKDGIDTEAVGFMMGMAAADVNAAAGGTADKVLLDMTNNVMFNIGIIAGSPATVAKKMDEVSETGVGGMMLTFPDFEKGIDRFGKEVMPLMKSN